MVPTQFPQLSVIFLKQPPISYPSTAGATFMALDEKDVRMILVAFEDACTWCETLADLTDRVLEIGGTVSLVKNICARPEAMVAILEPRAMQLRQAVGEVDPTGVYSASFIPRLLRSAYGLRIPEGDAVL